MIRSFTKNSGLVIVAAVALGLAGCASPAGGGNSGNGSITIDGSKYSLSNIETILEYSGDGTTDVIFEGGSARYTDFEFSGTGIFVVVTIPSTTVNGTFTSDLDVPYAGHIDSGDDTEISAAEGSATSDGLTFTRDGDQVTVTGTLTVGEGVPVVIDYSGPVQDLVEDEGPELSIQKSVY